MEWEVSFDKAKLEIREDFLRELSQEISNKIEAFNQKHGGSIFIDPFKLDIYYFEIENNSIKSEEVKEFLIEYNGKFKNYLKF